MPLNRWHTLTTSLIDGDDDHDDNIEIKHTGRSTKVKCQSILLSRLKAC